MGRTFILKIQSVVKYASVLLFILISVWISGLLSTYTRTKTEELFLTPIITDAKGWDIYTVENGSRRELSTEQIMQLESDKVFYLSRILTQEQERDGYSFLQLEICRPCAVFLDGELLYTNCPQDNMHIGSVSFPQDYTVTLLVPGESVRCSLPANFAGKRLTIATAHTDDFSMPGIRLSSYAASSELLITATSSELMPAAEFAVMALLLSGIWLFAIFQGSPDYPSLLLIAAAMIQMLSHMRQFEYLSPVSYNMDNPLAVFIPVIEVMLPLIWLLLQMKDHKDRLIFGSILGISTAIALISPIGGLFGGLPFFSPFLEKNVILFFPLSTLLFFSVREAFCIKNRIFVLLLSGLCITVCSIAAIYMGSLYNDGFYANEIAYVFRQIHEPTITLFFYWSALILFVLSAILALYQIIRRIAGMRTDLTLQTEHAKQLDMQLSAQRDFYEAKLAHENALRSLRHDMAGHLSTLAVLLDNNKTAEAKNYLDDITKYHKEQASVFFSKNPYVNAILQNYSVRCREQHIKLTCYIGIGEQELPIMDLCLILNNALENALEGSLTMPEGERVIKLQTAVRQNLFLLRVSNRFNGQLTVANGLPVSTKKDKGHGYGLSNIRQAAERRDGSMEYHAQDGYFVLAVTFLVD